MNSIAPITLFVYNRLWHTRQTIEALLQNDLAKDSDLIIFSDYPKNKDAQSAVENVRKYLRTIKGFKQIKIIEREKKYGLPKSIIEGVTQIVNQYGKIIVMEDDLICSPFYLQFMNDALEYYKEEEKVISIHGYNYPVKTELPDTFFLKGADCWGWATWKRGWNLFEPDGAALLAQLKHLKLKRKFDFNGSYPFTRMLMQQVKGKNDSWAIRWYASAFLKDKLTLYPGKSLICHIGNDGSGTHFGISNILKTVVSYQPIAIKKINIAENHGAVKEIARYFNSLRVHRAIDKLKTFLPLFSKKPVK